MLLRNINLFIEVSKSKSISDAAKRLYISQQTLSAAIHNLEKELGFSLFTRSSSGVHLTEKGTEFLSDAIKVQSIVDFWSNRVSAPGSSISGTVDVAAGEPFGTLLVYLISELRTTHPAITVNHHRVSSHEMPEFIRQKKARIGMAASSSLYSVKDLQQFAQDNKLEMEQIGLSRLVMIINKNNNLCREESLSLGDCKSLCLAVRHSERSMNMLDISKCFRKVYSFSGIKEVIRFVGENEDVAAFIPAITYKEDVMPVYPSITGIKMADYGAPHPLFLFHPKQEECAPEELIVINLIRKLEKTRSYRDER